MHRRHGVVERTHIARKAAGISVNVMATALGVSKDKYKRFERDTEIPLALLPSFCVIARCDARFITHGAGQIAPGDAPIIELDNLVSPRNLCGGPCVYRHFWCRHDCDLAKLQ